MVTTVLNTVLAFSVTRNVDVRTVGRPGIIMVLTRVVGEALMVDTIVLRMVVGVPYDVIVLRMVVGLAKNVDTTVLIEVVAGAVNVETIVLVVVIGRGARV